MRRALCSGVALAVASLVIGCGDTQPTHVVAPRALQRQDVMRYPPGTPQRATLELLRAVQFNDPEATSRFLAPAWGLSRAKIAYAVDTLRAKVLAWRVPGSLAVEYLGRRTASVIADIQGHRVTLRWAHSHGGWRLTGIGVRSEKLARDITNFIFFANHPELHGRRIRPGEDALAHEWMSVWDRILRLGH